MRAKPNPKGVPILKKKIDNSREYVLKLAQLGCTNEEIADIAGMSVSSLKKHLKKEMDEGRGNLRQSLRKAQIEAAIREKNTGMLIWLGKCYLGQKEPKHNIEHSGALTIEKVTFSRKEKK